MTVFWLKQNWKYLLLNILSRVKNTYWSQYHPSDAMLHVKLCESTMWQPWAWISQTQSVSGKLYPLPGGGHGQQGVEDS